MLNTRVQVNLFDQTKTSLNLLNYNHLHVAMIVESSVEYGLDLDNMYTTRWPHHCWSISDLTVVKTSGVGVTKAPLISL